jgi:hypothetical protein
MRHFLKKRWFWTALTLLVLVALAVVPESRWRIIGWVKRESFYQDRPTSFWSAELQNWSDVCGFPFHPDEPTKMWTREPGRWEVWASKYFPLALSRVPKSKSPALLDRDTSAVPVLTELLADANWKVRRIAAEGLSKLGPDARSAWPALQAALAADNKPMNFLVAESPMDEETKFRYYAAQALFAIDPEASREAGMQAPLRLVTWGW